MNADRERPEAGYLDWLSTNPGSVPDRRPEPETDEPSAPLSPRERDIIRLAGQGLRDPEIATALGLKLHTVRSYWKRIKNKMRGGSRAKMVRIQAELSTNEQLDRALRDLAVSDAVVRSVEGFLFVLDDEGRFVRFNDECQSAFGWSEEEVLGRSPLDLLIPDGVRETARRFLAEAKASGRAQTATFDWQTRDAVRRTVRWRAQLAPIVDDGAYVVVTGIEAPRILTAAEMAPFTLVQCKAMAAALQDGLIVQDETGGVDFVNEAALEVLGYAADSFLEPDQWDALGFTGDRFPALVALRTGEPQRLQRVRISLPGQAGGEKWLTMTSIPFVDPELGVRRVATSFRESNEPSDSSDS